LMQNDLATIWFPFSRLMACCSIALQIEMQNQKHFNFILCENCFATAAHSYLYCPLCFQEDRYWITEVRLAALTQTLKLDCRLVSFRTGPEVFKRLLASFLTRVKYLVLKRATAVPNLKDARWHPRNWVVSCYLFLSYLWKLVASIWDFYIFSIYWGKIFVPIRCCKHKPKTITQLKTKRSHFGHGTAEGSFVNFSSPWILWSAWPPWNPHSDPQELLF
jgi:hypothetical protein